MTSFLLNVTLATYCISNVLFLLSFSSNIFSNFYLTTFLIPAAAAELYINMLMNVQTFVWKLFIFFVFDLWLSLLCSKIISGVISSLCNLLTFGLWKNIWLIGLPWWVSGKESTCQIGDIGLIPGLGRSPEKEVATLSSILAWKIPWIEQPGRLQSMGSQKSWTQLSD